MADVSINDNSNEAVRRYADGLSGAKNTLDGLIGKMEEFKKLNASMLQNGVPADVVNGIKADQELVLKEYAAQIAGNDADGENLTKFVRGIMEKSLDELTNMIREAKMKLSVTKDSDAKARYQQDLDVLNNQVVARKGEVAGGKPVLPQEWKDFSTVSSDMFRTVAEGMQGFNDLDAASKAALKTLSTVVSETFKGIEQIVALTTTSASAVDGTSKSAFSAMSTVEKASAILAVVTTAMKIASAIANLFGDGAKEKKIKELGVSIDALSISYNRLGKSLETTYASDSVKILEDQNENLLAQKELVEEQMALEESKKNTDRKKMNDYQRTLDKINDDIKANENKMVKAIIGKDVKDAINEFATAYMNAWESGTDKAKAMKDVVKGMIRSAIGEFVKARLSGKVEEFTKYLAKAMEDGVITQAESAELARKELAIENEGDELDKQLTWAKDKNEPDRSASSKGIAQASQESVDDLSGRITTIQGHTYGILEEVRQQGVNSQEILAQMKLVNESAMHLKRLEVIEKRICSMDANINEAVIKGIKLNNK